jgi:Kdo2-lipid IVA lauroyltransferase/acyltransferase
MNRFFSALLYYGVLIPISVLPYPVLYRVSDALYYLMYYVVRYRKQTVLLNIQRSFPDKSQAEHIQIAKEFYRHFCDVAVESFKVFTITQKEVQQRMVFVNPEALDVYAQQNQSVIVVGGHYNNWELFAVAFDAPIKHQGVAIYKKLKNQYLDEKMRESRGKYGLRLISTRVVKEEFEKDKSTLTATIFAIDQAPKRDSGYWTMFLNQETSVAFGAEKYAREYNYPVVFGHIKKIKRGHYQFALTPLVNEPLRTAPGEISEQVTRMLEHDIIEAPAYWLWTHKRWKHKRPADMPLHRTL